MNSIRNFFTPQMPGPFGNLANFAQKFQEFSKNPVGAILGMKNINTPQNFNGTPEDMVKYLLQTGQMTQEQYQQFSQTANQMSGIFTKR